MTTNHRFTKRLRLLRPREFDHVFRQRASAADSSMVVYGAVNELDHPRLGLAVSRKVGGAVVRNRWKRSIREAFRRSQHDLPALDYVCLPRPGAPVCVARLLESWPRLAARIEQRLQHGVEKRQAPDRRS